MLLLRALTLLFFICFCSLCLAAEQKFIKMDIQGIFCPFCINQLIKNLGNLPGVQEVRISSDSERLLIVMLPNQDPNLSIIKNTLQKSGFSALKIEEASTDLAESEKHSALGGPHVEIKNQACNTCHH